MGILALAAGALTWGAGLLRDSKALEENLVRLHVVANSDSQEDQDLKLQVRDAIVAQLNGVMEELDSAQEAKEFLAEHLGELEDTANRVLQQAGSHLKAQVSLALEEFPTRVYDTFQLPAGLYEALRVTIGEGAGHNWWCVLYPNLCFMDSVHAIVPKEGKEELRSVLTDEEYAMIVKGTPVKIKWFFLQLTE